MSTGQFYQERELEGIVWCVIVYSVCILSDFSLDCSKVNSNLQWIPARVCVVWCETEMPSAGNFLKNIPKFSQHSFDSWLVLTWAVVKCRISVDLNIVFVILLMMAISDLRRWLQQQSWDSEIVWEWECCIVNLIIILLWRNIRELAQASVDHVWPD